MCKIWLISALFFFRLTNGFAQDYSSIQTLWVGDERMDLYFNVNKVQSKKYNFLDTFKISGDTLYIHHDYTGKEYYKNDSLGNLVEMEGYKLSDSQFRIFKLDSFEMILLPLNSSAKKITADVYLPDFKISHYDLTTDTEVIESPRIILKSKKNIYEKIEFDTIYLSYKSQGYHDEIYYDLILYKNGQFWALKKKQDYKARWGIWRKKHNLSCQGILSDSMINHLQNLLCNSGINKYEDSRHFTSWASHYPVITMTIIFKGHIMNYNCSEVDFNILMLPFVKNLQQLMKFKHNRHKKIRKCFPTTKRKDLKSYCH
ncbi:MAG: hypothetical protein PSX81_05975 [bacterium]|nr:hypothetical protein [bacterium]